MARIAACIALACLTFLPARGQRGYGNTLFLRYPFDQWSKETAKPGIRWNVNIDSPTLSRQQRISVALHASIETQELRKHNDGDSLALLVRVEDPAGHRFQTGIQAPIARLRQAGNSSRIDFTVSAFLLPGDYTASMAVADTRTQAHSFMTRNLHVAPIGSDPLPNAWTGLPAVEFIPTAGIPEAWYLPQVRSRVLFPVRTSRTLRVDLLVNTTPSELGSVAAFRRNMESIVPSLRVLSGIQPLNGTLGLAIVDMNRQAVTWDQPDFQRPDWFSMRRAFTESGAITVDARTLAGQRRMLDYFAGEAARRVSARSENDTSSHILIVLSSPVLFANQDRSSLPDYPIDPGHRIFYICYSPMGSYKPDLLIPEEAPTLQRPVYNFGDDLEHILKPRGARVFRVATPMEFRKALGSILNEAAKL